jgi:hypothetical protein
MEKVEAIKAVFQYTGCERYRIREENHGFLVFLVFGSTSTPPPRPRCLYRQNKKGWGGGDEGEFGW